MESDPKTGVVELFSSEQKQRQDYYERLVAYIEELAGDWQGSKNYYLAASARQFAEALRTYREENNRFVPPASNPSAGE